jgi:hypothetical protein
MHREKNKNEQKRKGIGNAKNSSGRRKNMKEISVEG